VRESHLLPEVSERHRRKVLHAGIGIGDQLDECGSRRFPACFASHFRGLAADLAVSVFEQALNSGNSGTGFATELTDAPDCVQAGELIFRIKGYCL